MTDTVCPSVEVPKLEGRILVSCFSRKKFIMDNSFYKRTANKNDFH
jgi:hypothetical protein